MLFLIMLSGNLIYGQESDCKVILPRLSGTYKGECKNGFAHGNGLAQGIDRYEGEFRKGMPEGRGVYRWSDGTFYDGSWKKGLREGYVIKEVNHQMVQSEQHFKEAVATALSEGRRLLLLITDGRVSLYVVLNPSQE